MAVAYQSSASTDFAASTTITITKPSGLAVGDLMVAALESDEAVASDPTPPSVRWNQLRKDGGPTNQHKSTIYWCIATAAETGATNFTWTQGAANRIGGGIARYTGHDTTTPIATSNSDTATGSNPTFTNTITPPADCILVLIGAERGLNSTIMSGQAITTSNPTWTELWDLQTELSDDYGFSYATSTVRSAATATGDSFITGGGASVEWIGQIFAIQPPVISATKKLTLLGVGT